MTFIDLRHGFFAYENHPYMPMTMVMDGNSLDPDRLYGPAAWDGQHGPHSGRVMCSARPASEDEFYDVGEAPPTWPRRIKVAEGEGRNPFRHLAGAEFPDEESLLHALAGALAGLPDYPLTQASAEGRLELAKVKRPEVFH